MVGRPQRAVGLALDEIDRAAQLESLVERDRVGRAVRVAVLLVGESEGQLEAPGHPVALLGAAAQPLAQVDLHAVDAVVPDAIDGRAELFAPAGGASSTKFPPAST